MGRSKPGKRSSHGPQASKQAGGLERPGSARSLTGRWRWLVVGLGILLTLAICYPGAMFKGEVFRSALAAKKHDYRTVQYTATVRPARKAEFRYEVVQHQGRNKKQDNLTIVEVK